MLRRNLYFAPASVKIKAYKSCVVPILEYGSICWAPTSEKLSHSIEMVQHRAARFITNSFHKHISISQMLENLQLKSFEERRTRARLTMAYKILNKKVILEPDLLPKTNSQKKTPLRNCNMTKVGYDNHLFEPNLGYRSHQVHFSILLQSYGTKE